MYLVYRVYSFLDFLLFSFFHPSGLNTRNRKQTKERAPSEKKKDELDKLRKNPLYLGIRYGNIWDYDMGKELGKPEFIAGLKELAKNGRLMC